jgi:hypothetical protein
MSNVFISYSRTDQPYARQLAEEMRRRGLNVWIDDRIEQGQHWFDEIEQAIMGAHAFVVIMTPDANGSEWVRKEVLLAKRENKPIYPLLLSGREFGLLIDIQYADVRGGRMPPEGFYHKLFTPGVSPKRRTLDLVSPVERRLNARNINPKRRTLTLGMIGLVIGLFLACACAYVVMSNIYDNLYALSDYTGAPQNNFTAASGAAVNAQAFLSAIGQGDIQKANQYVCERNRGQLAETISAYLGSIGVAEISNVSCVAEGGNIVACMYYLGTLSSSGVAHDRFIMDDDLVCDVVATQ